MSNEAITWAYRQDVSSGAKFVLVALADMADEAHSCFPGQAKLAAMTGQGERTVRRQLLELEDGGFITRRRRFDGAGHRTSDRYVLQIPTGQSGHRPKRPVAKNDTPTGQSGQVSLREPTVTPQPPVSGGRNLDHCDEHRRFRATCSDCIEARRAAKARPEWCGRCNETTRLIEDADTALPRGRCPDCHPLEAAS